MPDRAESAEIWATFSVFDHVSPGAFLSEVVMYDKLVVPVPPRDEPAEWGRWEEEKWDPARQRMLLDALGPVVERVEWNQIRRGVWEQAYALARTTGGTHLRRTLAGKTTADGLFDRVPAMAQPVVATTPYTSLDELTSDLGIARSTEPSALPAATVSAVVGRQLLVPSDDSRSETELLSEAVAGVTSADYRNARAALHRRLQRFTRDGVTDSESLEAAAREIKEASDDMERAVQKRKIWTAARRVFSFAQIALGGVLTPLTPIGIGLIVVGVGQFTVTEKLADPNGPERDAPDIAMLLDLRKELQLGT